MHFETEDKLMEYTKLIIGKSFNEIDKNGILQNNDKD